MGTLNRASLPFCSVTAASSYCPSQWKPDTMRTEADRAGWLAAEGALEVEVEVAWALALCRPRARLEVGVRGCYCWIPLDAVAAAVHQQQ